MKVRDFVDAVKQGRNAPIRHRRLIYNQAIIDAMVTSARERCEVGWKYPKYRKYKNINKDNTSKE